MTDQVTDQTATQPQLQLQDIVVAIQAIGLASTRGAFRPEEFTRIGGSYDRIVGFLTASGALTPAAPAEPAQADTASQGN